MACTTLGAEVKALESTAAQSNQKVLAVLRSNKSQRGVAQAQLMLLGVSLPRGSQGVSCVCDAYYPAVHSSVDISDGWNALTVSVAEKIG